MSEPTVLESEEALRARIEALTDQSSIAELRAVCAAVFNRYFGVTSDKARMTDIKMELFEFLRASTRRRRVEESGDVLSDLMVWSSEQDVDPVRAVQGTLSKIMRRAPMYASRGNKLSVAVYGGSFNMPHKGHRAVARAILNSNRGIDQVWFTPANQYMGPKVLADPRHRLAMCARMGEEDPRFRACDIEIRQNLSGETLLLVNRLAEDPMSDQHRFYFVLSTETAEQAPKWANFEELESAVSFIVLPRPGHVPDIRKAWYLREPHLFLAEADDLINISSTDVRNAYAAGDIARAESMLTPGVSAYIREHGLYQSQAATV